MLSNTGINKVILLGKITSTPFRKRKIGNEDYLCIILLTEEVIKRSSDNIGHKEHHKIRIPEKLIEQDEIYLENGQTVYIEGKTQTTSYIDEIRVKRYDLEIIASKIEVIANVGANAIQ
ncbi:single-stranded DNA-binding protein [Mucilaginibacter segetis]|uniref:Single-stranded DNA-binding protein n=1 Tax=Mucilaginibacter segetis TaxID=2793071 RepID=A0A934ULG6_9SPHI|nr:single-stranded DNA-binding protein [Mucilaginibacter segetis]MBK0378324.1 single-stranded DNA-binding protein [Mucilaginibacter segetis]